MICHRSEMIYSLRMEKNAHFVLLFIYYVLWNNEVGFIVIIFTYYLTYLS